LPVFGMPEKIWQSQLPAGKYDNIFYKFLVPVSLERVSIREGLRRIFHLKARGFIQKIFASILLKFFCEFLYVK